MIILAGFVLLASACTSKQVSEKTASGLNPADFRMEVDGKQTDLVVLQNKNGSLYYKLWWTDCISNGTG